MTKSASGIISTVPLFMVFNCSSKLSIYPPKIGLKG
jgi:hypothetical protein